MASPTRTLVPALTGGLCLLAAGAILAAWWGRQPVLTPQEPGADRPGYAGLDAGSDPAPTIGRNFRPGTALGAEAARLPGAWPGFRGPDRTNVSPDRRPLSDLSDYTPRRLLWTVTLGEGHAGAAVAEGRVYVLDYDEATRSEALRCLSLLDGHEVWRRSYPLKMKRNHGYSRTVPQVAGRLVLTLGPLGQVMAVDRLTGDLAWSLDPAVLWHASAPLWYAGQCPLVDGDTLVLAVGGDVLMAGIDLATGLVRWTTPNPDGAQATHASVMPMTVGTTPVYLACFSNGFTGLSAGGAPGQVLFRIPDWSVQVEVPSPLALPGGKVYLTAGYGAGNMLVQLTEAEPGRVGATVVFRHAPGEALSCEQQTPVEAGGFVYGIQTKDAGAFHDQLVCMAPDGSIVWTSPKDTRFGLGPYLLADGKLFVFGEDGWMTVVTATARGYEQRSRQRIIEATDAWAPLALAGDRLLLRDAETLVCLDLAVAR